IASQRRLALDANSDAIPLRSLPLPPLQATMHTPDRFAPAHVLPANLSADALAFVFRGDKVLVSGDEASDPTPPRLPRWGELSALGVSGAPHYLGALEGADCLAAGIPDSAPEPAGWRYAGLRSLFFVLPDAHLALAARAFQ